jgi:hypothetical protein
MLALSVIRGGQGHEHPYIARLTAFVTDQRRLK